MKTVVAIVALLSSQVAGYFQIRPVNSPGNCVYPFFSSGNPVELSTCSHFHYHVFGFIPTSDGNFKLHVRNNANANIWITSVNPATAGSLLQATTTEPTGTPSIYFHTLVPSTVGTDSYMIKLSSANLCWQYGASTSTDLVYQTCDSTNGFQAFNLDSSFLRSRWVNLVSGTSQYLEVAAANTNNSAVTAGSNSNITTELFSASIASGKVSLFTSSMLCLTDASSTLTASTCVASLATQSFDFITSLGLTTFQLKGSSGNCVASTTSGSNVALATCNSTDPSQNWKFGSNLNQLQILRVNGTDQVVSVQGNNLHTTAYRGGLHQIFSVNYQKYGTPWFNRITDLLTGRAINSNTGTTAASLTTNSANFPATQLTFDVASGNIIRIRDGTGTNRCLQAPFTPGGQVISATCDANNPRQHFVVETFSPVASVCNVAPTNPTGLYVEGGQFKKNGQTYYGIGANYPLLLQESLLGKDLFGNVITDALAKRTENLTQLAAVGVSHVRLWISPFYPIDWTNTYFANKTRFFEYLDKIFEVAEQQNIGIIGSLFWTYYTVPDLMGEKIVQLGNSSSKSWHFRRNFTEEVVTRYRKSPALYGWEMGNEYNLNTDLPNNLLPPVLVDRGTPATRSVPEDVISMSVFRNMSIDFATHVACLDPGRPIFTGNADLRQSSYHNTHFKSWTNDSNANTTTMIGMYNPDPFNTVTTHTYNKTFWNKEIFTMDAAWTLYKSVADGLGKPLYLGEFGYKRGDTVTEAQTYATYLCLISKHQIQLSSWWVFHYAHEYQISFGNGYGWLIDDIVEKQNEMRAGTFDTAC